MTAMFEAPCPRWALDPRFEITALLAAVELDWFRPSGKPMKGSYDYFTGRLATFISAHFLEMLENAGCEDDRLNATVVAHAMAHAWPAVQPSTCRELAPHVRTIRTLLGRVREGEEIGSESLDALCTFCLGLARASRRWQENSLQGSSYVVLPP